MVDERPNSIGLLMGYANILSNQGEYDQALCYYDRVQHLKPSWVRPLECQCLLEDYKKGEKSKSMELARKILGLDEENKIGLFVSARNQETVEGKIVKLKELVAIYPKYARGFHELGLIFGGEKQEYKEAISWYQEATELTPSYCSCYNNIGINYELLKNTD
jgi:tetratricopeptide (TPR) repeat protein